MRKVKRVKVSCNAIFMSSQQEGESSKRDDGLITNGTTRFINVPKLRVRHVPRTYANDLSRSAAARFIIRSRTLSNYHK